MPLLQKILQNSTGEGEKSLDELFGETGYALVRLAGLEGLKEVQAAFRRNRRWLPRLYLLRALGA